MITKIEKRNGQVVDFNVQKIENAIHKALTFTKKGDAGEASVLSEKVFEVLLRRFSKDEVPTVEDIQNIVEEVLIMEGFTDTARSYILYREKRREVRDALSQLEDSSEIIEKYIDELDWEVKENANMTYSLQGLNQHATSHISKKYWLNKIYPYEIREAAKNQDFHIHDLNLLATYCCGWDLQDLLLRGFGGVPSKIESKPPKHFRPALGQIVNFFFTLQGESAGAQAMSNFDTFLAPFIRYDNLDYKQVKQSLQEFLFNCMVPTRVGFQCLSEDTEILTSDGWKKYNEVEKGDVIKTFNPEKVIIEEKRVKKIFRREYKGKMYNLLNRIQDQLVSPEHRIVRKKFNSEKYCLEKIEDFIKLKTSQIIPISANNNNKEVDVRDEEIKLVAWIVSEGSMETKKNWRRIVIYQSKKKNKEKYEEIISLLEKLEIEYTTQEGSKSLGETVAQIRFNADNSRKLLELFNSNKTVKVIPEKFLEMSQRQSRLFLEEYIKGDGHEDCKITVSDKKILGDLQRIIFNSGYGFTTAKRMSSGVGKKMLYILRVIKHQETGITKIEEIDYKGVIWSVNTENETVIAKRKGKVFITGNTPFLNVSLDIKIPSFLKNQPVIIGGEAQRETYGEFQKEVDIFNKAFYECLMEGDSKGRVFTFPIPTISITKDFDWDNESLVPMWEATAKYGVNYFSNFVNSDMNPEDFRSMCCRLRLSNKELIKRGGGLFGSQPLTGSIGVCTINLPRIGYLSKNKDEFYNRLGAVMDLAKESLEIKRKAVDNFIEKGLYPYSKHYLSSVKKMRGSYFGNHFSTIGLIGMNEALLNFIGEGTGSEEGRKLAAEILDFMRNRLIEYQEKTGNLYNLEATPGEGAAYRQASIDKKRYPDIITAGTKDAPYYTNSVHLPVGYTDDPFEALELQDELQQKFTGGTVLHLFLGERLASAEGAKNLVKKVLNNYHLPYITITPTFSVCPNCGYLKGEQYYCPNCKIKGPKKIIKNI
jgi:ribonucleoside-triphosphate reductase